MLNSKRMFDLIDISNLNDFIFCPYSIYLHNVYMDTDEGNYHAMPQTQGRNAHTSIDNKSTSTSNNVIESLSVISHELGIYGKIDVYRISSKTLVERKYRLKQIFQGQIYQLWAQYFCMTEMGYEIDNLAFYEISTRKTTQMQIPNDSDKVELKRFVDYYRAFSPQDSFPTNPNKCAHCIYSNLCDKTTENNVYT